MCEDLADEWGILDASNHSEFAAAFEAGFDVDKVN
jgi:hypothetical protein